MVDVVGSNLKMVKLFSQHLWTLHDAVVVWPGSRNNVALGHVTCRNTAQHGGQTRATFCIQHMFLYVAPEFCDRLAGACKTWVNNVAICCAELLRSFGRGFAVLKCLVCGSYC